MENEEEDKETIEEENEDKDEEEKKDSEKLKDSKLAEIIMDGNGLKAVKFNKEKCIENNLLKKSKTVFLYSNFYPIHFKKDIEICENPFLIKPEFHEESVILKVLREASQEIFKRYGYYYRSGNRFFIVKRFEEDRAYKVVIHH